MLEEVSLLLKEIFLSAAAIYTLNIKGCWKVNDSTQATIFCRFKFIPEDKFGNSGLLDCLVHFQYFTYFANLSFELLTQHSIKLILFWMRCESIHRRSCWTRRIVNSHFQKFIRFIAQSIASSSLAPLSPLFFVTSLNLKAGSLCWLEMGTTLKHWVILSEHCLINLVLHTHEKHTHTQTETHTHIHTHCLQTAFCICLPHLGNLLNGLIYFNSSASHQTLFLTFVFLMMDF